MPDLDYVKVVGRLGIVVRDEAADDPDLEPDTVWCDSGSVIFTPLVTAVKVVGADPVPATLGQSSIVAEIDSEGYLSLRGTREIHLVDLGSTKVNPFIPAGKATHKVEFVDTSADGSPVSFPTPVNARFSADTAIDGKVDITLVTPVPVSGGTAQVIGRDGVSVLSMAIVANELVYTLSDSTTGNAGALPQLASNEAYMTAAQTAATEAAASEAAADADAASALASKNAAATSETNAASSATAAASSATAADNSASSASASATTSSASATSAAASASSAATSETNAATSATAAASSATSAGTSATNAGNSATAAATSASNAATSKTDADSAKTAAESARDAAVTAKTAAETARTGAETAQTGAQTARSGAETAQAAAEAAAAEAEAIAGGGVTSINGASGSVTLNQDNLPDGTTNRSYTQVEKTKLAGVAAGATANSTDAQLRDRSTHTGTQAASTITGLAAVATSGSASDITTGTLPNSVLPPLAVNETFTANSQAEMLALTAQRGDIAIRTDVAKTYVLSSDSPSTLADWREFLATGQVVSVSGKTGVVSLVKGDVGLGNVDNTSDLSKPISTATQTALDGKAASSHTHDDRYYTESEADVRFDRALGALSSGDFNTLTQMGSWQINGGGTPWSGFTNAPTGGYQFGTLEVITSGTSVTQNYYPHQANTEVAVWTRTKFNANDWNPWYGVSRQGHTHDDRYYTEAETDTLLSGKAASTHTHTKSQITDFAHTHAAADINSGTLATARLGSGTANSTTFLRGDGTWAEPAGSGVTVENKSITYTTVGNNAWSAKAPMPSALMHCRAAYWGGKVYVLGGQTTTSTSTTIASVYAYDVAANTWSTLASFPSGRGNHSVIAHQGYIYLLGGYSASGTATNTFYRYSILNDSWETLAVYPAGIRINVGLVAQGQYIYAFGGYTGSAASGTLYRFDTMTLTWSAALASGTTGSGPAGVELSSGLLMFFVTGKSTAFYDPETNAWSTGPDAPFVYQSARAFARMSDGFYHLFGATSPIPHSTYNEVTNSWSLVEQTLVGSSMGLATDGSHKAFGVGGYDNSTVLDQMKVYEIQRSAPNALAVTGPALASSLTSGLTLRNTTTGHEGVTVGIDTGQSLIPVGATIENLSATQMTVLTVE